MGIRLLLVWLSLSSVNIPQRKHLHYNKQWLPHPVSSMHPPDPLSILLYGYNGKSPCKDPSSVSACSVVCCWVGHSGAPADERGVASGWLCPWTEVTVFLKTNDFLLVTSSTPPPPSLFLWSREWAHPCWYLPQGTALSLKMPLSHPSWGCPWSPLLHGPFIKHVPPSQCIVPVWVGHQVLFGPLMCKINIRKYC